MEADGTAGCFEHQDESESEIPFEHAASGPLPGAASKRRRDVTLAELQEQFALLQQEFELFQEGRTRPPTRAHGDVPAAPAPVPRIRTPRVFGRADRGAPVAGADGARSQTAPRGARVLRDSSPMDSRPDNIRPREPPVQPPTRAARPLNAAAGCSPAAPAPPRPRPTPVVSGRRLPSPPLPQNAGKAAPEGLAVGNGKPQVKKVKKVERPPWRDDFTVDPSPWSQELAQEQAAALEAAASVASTGGDSSGEALPLEASNSGRGRDSKKREGRWWTGGSSDGGGRDAPSSPGAAPGLGEALEEGAKRAQAPLRRRLQPTTAASVRAAAVAAAIEAGRQQQLIQQQQQDVQQQAARGAMPMLTSTGSGDTVGQQAAPGVSGFARISPSRCSHIPSLPCPGSESRPRTQQSRIPAFTGHPDQQDQQLPPQNHQDDRSRRQSGPTAPSVPGGSLVVTYGGEDVDRLVVDIGVSSSFSSEDLLGNSAETSPTLTSNITSNPQHQRRRRQWEVPGAAVAGEGAASHTTPRVVDGTRPCSSSDGSGDVPLAAANMCLPTVGVVSRSAPSSGRAFNPTPPSSRPPSRPGSRPSSRPTSNTGDATIATGTTATVGHQPPSSPPAYTDQDARQHTSPERPKGHRVSSVAGDNESHGGRALQASEPVVPDVTFAVGRSAGAVLEDQLSGRKVPPTGQLLEADDGAAGSFEIAIGTPSVSERTAELILPVVTNGAGSSGAQKTGPGRGQGPGAGPLGQRDKEEYLRKLSALKRSVPQDPLRRMTEDGANQAGIGVTVGGSSSSGGGSAGPSRKWMEPGSGDAPLSAAPVDAVGSAPAAVRAARSRNLTADVLQIGNARGADCSGGSDAAETGDDANNASAAAGRMARPLKGRNQVHHGRSGSLGAVAAAGSYLGGGSRTSDSGQCAADAPQMPFQTLAVSTSPPHSPSRLSPLRGPRISQQDSGAQPPSQQQQISASEEVPTGGATVAAAAAISAEQYMAFAVQNPGVAMAAAQAAISANGSRARARWNVPSPPADIAAASAAGGGPSPWIYPQHPPPPPTTQPQQLAAAMVSANSQAIPAMPLLCSPSQASHPNPVQGSLIGVVDNTHDLRRANSEGPRMVLGRGPGSGMLDVVPPTSAPSGPGPGGLGPTPGIGGPLYGGGHPPHPPVQPPMVQGLFLGPSASAQTCWPGPGPGVGEGLPESSGRHPGFGPGGFYPSGPQPVRPPMAPPGEMWAGGPGAGPGPPLHMHPSGAPPPQHWNAYGYGPAGRTPGYVGGAGPGPGMMEAYGPMAHMGPIGDPYKPPLFKRTSNGQNDGVGGAGLGYAAAPPGAPGPCYSSGGGAAGGSDLPDYLRVSMSRMVAGWSAPNAKHGALSGFNDVWQHRNNNRPPPGPGMAAHNGGGGPGLHGSDGGVQTRGPSAGGGGGGGRETGFEGLSLEAVLASKPKKEVHNFKKKA